jgi:hypothetical protein
VCERESVCVCLFLCVFVCVCVCARACLSKRIAPDRQTEHIGLNSNDTADPHPAHDSKHKEQSMLSCIAQILPVSEQETTYPELFIKIQRMRLFLVTQIFLVFVRAKKL